MSDEKTDKLIARWRAAKDQVEQTRRELSAEETRLMNATNELAQWLTPADAKAEEKFSVWVEGSLIETSYDRVRATGTVKERPGTRQ